jgi:CTP:molybdopterin cytidylyltransferase MocA
MKTAGIITAAGLSSRMGEFKPLLPFNGATIIENTIQVMKQAGVHKIIVVTGHNRELLEQQLQDTDVEIVYNSSYADSDMMKSIQIGLEYLIQSKTWQPKDAFYILPGDMPAISPETLELLKNYLEQSNANIIFPTLDGRKKHPPLIHMELAGTLMNYQGSSGLRGALEQFQDVTVYLEVHDFGCNLDADTKDDYKRLLEYIQKME